MITIPFIYFTTLYYVMQKRYKSFNIGSYLLLVYIISSFFSIVTYNIKSLDYYKIEINLEATIFYCITLTIFIIPFYFVDSSKIKSIVAPNLKFFNAIGYIFIIVFIIILVTFLDDLKNIVNGDLKEARGNVYLGLNSNSKTGIFRLGAQITSIFANFTPITLLMYFYSNIYLNKSKYFNFGLFIASFSSVIPGILVAGRTQTIYWLMTYIMLYILFKHKITKEIKKYLLFPFLIFIPFIAAYMFLLTIARFDDGTDSGVINSVIKYGGQSFINFCNFYDSYESNYFTLERIFPFTNKFILGNEFNLDNYREKILIDQSLNIGIFYTFIGDLIVDLGKLGTIVYATIFLLLSKLVLFSRNKHQIAFNQILLLLILIHVPLHGIFYYSYWKIGTSYYIIGSIIIYRIFKGKNNLKPKY